MSAAKKQKLKNGARATKKKREEEDDDDFDDFDDQPRQVGKGLAFFFVLNLLFQQAAAALGISMCNLRELVTS